MLRSLTHVFFYSCIYIIYQRYYENILVSFRTVQFIHLLVVVLIIRHQHQGEFEDWKRKRNHYHLQLDRIQVLDYFICLVELSSSI